MAFATFGKPVHKKEALSTDVDLLTTRTDLKDGHTKFVYRIKSRRRESLKIILDFTGSTNLAGIGVIKFGPLFCKLPTKFLVLSSLKLNFKRQSNNPG